MIWTSSSCKVKLTLDRCGQKLNSAANIGVKYSWIITFQLGAGELIVKHRAPQKKKLLNAYQFLTFIEHTFYTNLNTRELHYSYLIIT